MLLLADKWKDYELIDMGNGEKLERWGSYVLRRPDPQVVWPMESEWALWKTLMDIITEAIKVEVNGNTKKISRTMDYKL